jgi:hypothetical protein
MQADPEVLERRLVARKLARLVALEQAVRDEIEPARADAGRARDPADGVQVAQPAGGLLEVRLERVRGVLVLRVALLLLELLRLEERHGVRLRFQGFDQFGKQAPAAREIARFGERGLDGDVFVGRAHAFGHGAHAVADLEAGVPEGADQALDAAALFPGERLRHEHQEIDVRARVKLAAAVAAGGDQRRAGEAGLEPQLPHGAIDQPGVLLQQAPRIGMPEVSLAQPLALGRHLFAQHGTSWRERARPWSRPSG